MTLSAWCLLAAVLVVVCGLLILIAYGGSRVGTALQREEAHNPVCREREKPSSRTVESSATLYYTSTPGDKIALLPMTAPQRLEHALKLYHDAKAQGMNEADAADYVRVRRIRVLGEK